MLIISLDHANFRNLNFFHFDASVFLQDGGWNCNVHWCCLAQRLRDLDVLGARAACGHHGWDPLGNSEQRTGAEGELVHTTERLSP